MGAGYLSMIAEQSFIDADVSLCLSGMLYPDFTYQTVFIISKAARRQKS